MKQKEQDGSVVPAVESETNMVPAEIDEAAVPDDPDGADEPERCLENLQDQHGQPNHQDHLEWFYYLVYFNILKKNL